MAANFWKRLLMRSGDMCRKEETEQESSAEELTRLAEEGAVRRHYYFSGQVQEVGFRYTAFYLAQELGLTGWVANLADGRVEMELQGAPEKLELLISKLKKNTRIVIEKQEEEEIGLSSETKFKVRG